MIRYLVLVRNEDVAAILRYALHPSLTQLQQALLRFLDTDVHVLHIGTGIKQAPGLEVPRGLRAARD